MKEICSKRIPWGGWRTRRCRNPAMPNGICGTHQPEATELRARRSYAAARARIAAIFAESSKDQAISELMNQVEQLTKERDMLRAKIKENE